MFRKEEGTDQKTAEQGAPPFPFLFLEAGAIRTISRSGSSAGYSQPRTCRGEASARDVLAQTGRLISLEKRCCLSCQLRRRKRANVSIDLEGKQSTCTRYYIQTLMNHDEAITKVALWKRPRPSPYRAETINGRMRVRTTTYWGYILWLELGNVSGVSVWTRGTVWGPRLVGTGSVSTGAAACFCCWLLAAGRWGIGGLFSLENHSLPCQPCHPATLQGCLPFNARSIIHEIFHALWKKHFG